jgi:radical SAM protein with 4Fe4S-binding SPASM domain
MPRQKKYGSHPQRSWITANFQMPKRFKKIYLEISNICNLQCHFCPEVTRPKQILSPENFEQLLLKVLPHTERVCLHLMGEPLSHPQFLEILEICTKHKAPIELTTNGTLLHKYSFEKLLNSSLVQINFSLHSYLDNFPSKNFKPYLMDVLQFSSQALTDRPDLYINYRFWTQSLQETPDSLNQQMREEIMQFFQIQVNERLHLQLGKSKRLVGRIYFHFDTQFKWPTLTAPFIGTQGTCRALDLHVGVHTDGRVVACCLDKEGDNLLGNLFNQTLEEILLSSQALRLKEDFKNHELSSPLCQRCDYRTRFSEESLSS